MGYINFSMSVRAAQAYQHGLKPLSKWTKTDIIDSVVESGAWTEGELKKYPKQVLADMFLEYQEWHHTSKMFNQTCFFGINLNAAETHDVEALDQLLAEYKNEATAKRKNTEPITIEKGFIRFETWEGSHNHPHLVEHEAYALIIGSVAYTQDGRKNLEGTHILSVKKFQRAPRGTANEFKKIHLPQKYQK